MDPSIGVLSVGTMGAGIVQLAPQTGRGFYEYPEEP